MIEAQGHLMPTNEERMRAAATFPLPSFPVPPKKRKLDPETTDETAHFQKRPSAVVNRPMVTIPIDKFRRNQIDLSMAQVDPSASFEERIAQFDHMEAVAKKRKLPPKRSMVMFVGVYSVETT